MNVLPFPHMPVSVSVCNYADKRIPDPHAAVVRIARVVLCLQLPE